MKSPTRQCESFALNLLREPKVVVMGGNNLAKRYARFFAKEYEMFLFFDERQAEKFLLSLDESEIPELLVVSTSGEDIDDAMRVAKFLLKHKRFCKIPFVVISSNLKGQSRRRFFESGAKDCIGRRTPTSELKARIERVLAEGSTISCLSTEMEEQALLAKRNADKLAKATLQVVDALLSTIGTSDSYTEGHCTRVKDVAIALAKESGYPEHKMPWIANAALLHDIGKLGVRYDILNKKEALDKGEFEQIKMHPETGYKILSRIDSFHTERDVALCHHERWDGKGYPRGISGEEIPIEARIVAIADAYDAMRFGRVYENPKTKQEIASEIEACSGTQFDPRLASIFAGMIRSEKL